MRVRLERHAEKMREQNAALIRRRQHMLQLWAGPRMARAIWEKARKSR